MATRDIPNPNSCFYTAANEGKYIATRLLTHSGTTIAFALGKSKDGQSLFIDYSILNADDQDPTAQEKPAQVAEKLDSQCWFDDVKALRFPSELRVVGQEAVPVYEIPALDRTGRSVNRNETEKLDPWLSTSLCLMDPAVTNFEVLSDGKYIYLFRQSRAKSDTYPNPFMKGSGAGAPPVDSNLLCDRFTLVGSSLNRALEVRYRRSRQKRLPMNDQDTLAVRDINDVPFYEPTFSLRFLNSMVDGRFSVLRTPTATNDVFRWMFFVYSSSTSQLECFTIDAAVDGLFDVHGQIYYTCEHPAHKPGEVFSTAPGACTAVNAWEKRICGNVKTPIIPKSGASQWAMNLGEEAVGAILNVTKPIDLSGKRFSKGFTIESWVNPGSFWTKKPDPAEGESYSGETPERGPNGAGPAPTTNGAANTNGVNGNMTEPPTGPEIGPPPTNSTFCLFSISQSGEKGAAWPSVFLDDKLRLVLRRSGKDAILASSEKSLQADSWSHIAVTYTPGDNGGFRLIIDGESPLSKPYAMAKGGGGGTLKALASQQAGDEARRFRGMLDEVRVWSYPLHPATIKAKMSKRVTGMEPYLEACWHFDEGVGLKAYDASVNGNDIDVVLKDPNASQSTIWQLSTVSLLGTFGLARRTIRLPAHVTIQGGLNASVYYEQISLSRDQKSLTNGASDGDSAKTSDSKPLKRGARVLLCFVAALSSETGERLAVLDFGLVSDGTLCLWPAIIPIAPIALSANKGQARPRASTALLNIDAQGAEIFGGVLNFDAARCGRDPPCVWDSSTGTIAIFFRSLSGVFSAVTYDASRSIAVNDLSSLSGHAGLLASSKLRQANFIILEADTYERAPPEAAVTLKVVAIMPDRSQIWEVWKGIPANLEKLCSVLNGSKEPRLGTVAKLNFIEYEPAPETKPPTPACRLVELGEPLQVAIPAGECLEIDGWFFMVAQEAKPQDRIIWAAEYWFPQAGEGEDQWMPRQGAPIIGFGYDYGRLVSCGGKPSGDFSQGSSLITMAVSESNSSVGSTESGLIKLGVKSTISTRGQSPFFSSPPPSTALKTAGDAVEVAYSMLEEAATTTSNPGITFESWLKVDKIGESVIAAYQSMRAPRSERADPEHQTFVLAIPAGSEGKSSYDLVGNANGMLFKVTDPEALRQGQWMHFACSLHNTLALRFSGANYVDLGNAPEFNVSDFTLAFTLQLEDIGRERVIFTKAVASSGMTPLLLKVLARGELCLSYWAGEDDGANVRERWIKSPEGRPLVKGETYKIFVSRNLVRVDRSGEAPRAVQRVTMRAWRTDDSVHFDVQPPSLDALKQAESKGQNSLLTSNGPAIACGNAYANDHPLTLGGASWATKDNSLVGTVGPIRFYSAAMAAPASSSEFCRSNRGERSLIGSWSFRADETVALLDDGGRNNGKLKGDPTWVVSPFKPDHQFAVFINGQPATTSLTSESVSLRTPVGPHQLTLGNAMHGDDTTHYLAMRDSFHGELDEFRIWNVPRTRENICDTMNARLSEVPIEIAVYLPFDDPDADKPAGEVVADDTGILSDASTSCWHLTPLLNGNALRTPSHAPVGYDATCVHHVLSSTDSAQTAKGAQTVCCPSIAEYGDMQVSANGGMEGSYKRAYAYISPDGRFFLETGFRIGSLITEWVSQVQTSPTLIGYIEGAPPIAGENYLVPSDRPASAVRFSNAQRCIYSYGLRNETGQDKDDVRAIGTGAKWESAAGFGFTNLVTAGNIKASVKKVLDVSSSQVKNSVSTLTTNTNMEMRVELTGAWKAPAPNERDIFEPANNGLALVESEVADVFALRLKMRGPVAPLVAYQMRPNPDIPKDRNLVSFQINNAYTKQGTLDGWRGSDPDKDYTRTANAPKDASYFKPAEAYALKDRIRRAEEQLAGEYERYQMNGLSDSKRQLPTRTRRNICNSYVWTADGGTFQETHSSMDFIQTEVGGNANHRASTGVSVDAELAFGVVLGTMNVDALWSSHTSIMQTKQTSSETGFELQTELPPAVEIRREDAKGNLVKRPGAVDAYRWMSFWLEPSTEGTDAFFRQVVDPRWLEESGEPNAKLLLQLRDSLGREKGTARTKAWRVFHRCTYVSRVLEKVPSNMQAAIAAATEQNQKKGSVLLADVSCNWLILQQLEPLARGQKDKIGVARMCEDNISALYPSLRENNKLYNQLIDLMAGYLGLE